MAAMFISVTLLKRQPLGLNVERQIGIESIAGIKKYFGCGIILGRHLINVFEISKEVTSP